MKKKERDGPKARNQIQNISYQDLLKCKCASTNVINIHEEFMRSAPIIDVKDHYDTDLENVDAKDLKP